MPVALVPEGFKLQKVTQLQKEAVDSYNNNTSVQAFFDGPASGELVKAIAFVVTPIILIDLDSLLFFSVQLYCRIVQTKMDYLGTI